METTTTTTTITPSFEALHMLRITGSTTRDYLSAAAGAETVDALLAGGLLHETGPRVVLTPAGRTAHEQVLASEVDEQGCRAAVEDCYQRFLPLNAEVLQFCTDWQLRMEGGTPVPNDHRDAAYDAAVIDRAAVVHHAASQLLEELAAALPRFASYRGDLAAAFERVQGGDTDFLTNPRVRCFHTVWFELHEDLLATLGIDRAAEGEPTAPTG